MEGSGDRTLRALIWAWTLAVIVFMYLPALSLLLASSTASRYFIFPINALGLRLVAARPSPRWRSTSSSRRRSHRPVRHGDRRRDRASSARWPLRATTGTAARVYQKIVLLPIFFPQSVLGLALLLWFNALGLHHVLADGRLCASGVDHSGRARW